MAGSFLLELDTTGPEIEITSPNYTTPSAKTDIYIYANEELSPDQDFYFIDAEGNRHDVVFDHLGDHFHGVMYFTDFPTGIVNFYAQVKDTTLNLSPVETASINIAEQQFFSVSVKHFNRGAQVNHRTRSAETGARSRKVGVYVVNE